MNDFETLHQKKKRMILNLYTQVPIMLSLHHFDLRCFLSVAKSVCLGFKDHRRLHRA